MNLLYLRYMVVSAGALGVDMALFLAAMSFGMPAAPAAAIGYLAGVVAHWLLSSRAVFTGKVAKAGAARWQQRALFFGSALIGLALTTGIVGLGSALGLDPRLAKLAAIGISFQATYLLRLKVVFA